MTFFVFTDKKTVYSKFTRVENYPGARDYIMNGPAKKFVNSECDNFGPVLKTAERNSRNSCNSKERGKQE